MKLLLLLILLALQACATRFVPEWIFGEGGPRVRGADAIVPYRQFIERALTRQLKEPLDTPLKVFVANPGEMLRAMIVAGISGTVIVRFDVSSDGFVTGAKVVSSPHPGLSEASLASIRSWRFGSIMRNGKPATLHDLVWKDEYRIE